MPEPGLPYRIFSRALDCCFALGVTIFLFWLLIICWAAIRLTSPGSPIFRQPRVGRNGRVFTCYKFRTMRLGVKQAGTHEMPADAIAPLGRLLRRTKIDELPQIFNLYRGEMSLIGPRPCLPSQRELVELRTRLGVLTIRPGITGLAQISGVDMSDPERLAKLDALYVQTRSARLDIRIIFETLLGRGSGDYVKQ